MTTDPDASAPTTDERWRRLTSSPSSAVVIAAVTGLILLGGAYAAIRTGLETVALGGFAPGDGPRPRPAGFTTVGLLALGAGLAWAGMLRRVTVVALAAATVLLLALVNDDHAITMWAAVAVNGVSVGVAAATFRWHARSTHWRRRRAALVAIVLAVMTSLATGDFLAVLALLIALPLSAVTAALLLPPDDAA